MKRLILFMLLAANGLIPVSAGEPAKEWTLLLYLNGNSRDIADDVQYMLGTFSPEMNPDKIPGSKNVNVVVQLSTNTQEAARHVLRDGVFYETDRAVVDMGDWRTAANFLKWGREKFPAKRYMFVIGGHGAGWDDRIPDKDRPNRGISYDDQHGSFIRTSELPLIFRQSGRVDIFAMEACLMQQIEVDYEIADYTDAIIAPQEKTSYDFMHYYLVMRVLEASGGAENLKVAADIVRAQAPIYAKDDTGDIVTISAINTAALKKFVGLLGPWTQLLITNNEIASVKTALNAQNYYRQPELPKDLGRALEILSRNAVSPEAKSRGKMLYDLAENEIILADIAMEKGKPAPGRSGISIKMEYPSKMMALISAAWEPYYELKFPKESGWGVFLKWAETKRPVF